VKEHFPEIADAPTLSSSTPGSSQGRDNHVFPFGKHKGKAFDEVCRSDKQYCQWLLSQAKKPTLWKPDTSESTRVFVRFVKEHFPEMLQPRASQLHRTRSHQAKYSSFHQKKPFTKGMPTSKTEPDSVPSKSSTSPSAGTEPTVESGSRLLNWGNKYASSTYAEIFDKDQNYCRWMVRKSLEEPSLMKVKYPSEVWPFIVYVQNRWSLGGHVPPPDAKVTA